MLRTEKMLARQREKNQAAISLFGEWLDDESGYDESVGPAIEKALKESRLTLRSLVPLAEARHEGHAEIVKVLQKQGRTA